MTLRQTVRLCKLIGVPCVLSLALCPHGFGGGAVPITWSNDGSLASTNSPLFSDSGGLDLLSAGLTNYIGDGYIVQLIAIQGGTNYVLATATVGDDPGAIYLAPFDGSFDLYSVIASNTLAGAIGAPMGVQFFNATSIGSATAYGVVSNLTLTVPTPDWDFPPFPLEWGLDATDTNFLGPRTTANGGFYTDTSISGGDARTGGGGSSSAGGGHGRPYVPPSSGGGGRFDPLFLISSSCPITNPAAPFLVGISQSTNRDMIIQFQSCPDHIYVVYSANVLTANTAWKPVAMMQGGSGLTSFTDRTTAGVTQRFYRVERLGRPLPGAPAIAAGELHSLALGPNGNLWSCGDNSHGQLGDGTTFGSLVPEPIGSPACSGISNAVSVTAGYDFSVALDASGTVWTWGGNQFGQLGNGLSVTNDYPTPSPITAVSNIVAVSAGAYHTLALRADGTVWAWGYNYDGELGATNVPTQTNSPVQSVGLTQIVAIAAGEAHSVALQQSGTVWTWGDDSYGELGNGGNGPTNVFVPAALTGISNVIAIAGGYFYTIALKSDGTVWTWGRNSLGELGRTNYIDSNSCGCAVSPGQVSALSNVNVVAIAGGNAFTLAATSNGQMYAWGDNSLGQLGVGSSVTGTNLPMLVPGISNVVLVSANIPADDFDGPHEAHILAVSVASGVTNYWGWGGNSSGEVGNGATTNQYTPQVLHFCPICTECIQFDTNGTFTAPCTGSLRLLFNDDNYNVNSGSYTVMVSSVGMTNVPSIDPSGVVIGTVSNGVTYSYSATGFITWLPNCGSCEADAGGRDYGGVLRDCDGDHGSTNSNPDSRSGFPCHSSICYSLVGKIE